MSFRAVYDTLAVWDALSNECIAYSLSRHEQKTKLPFSLRNHAIFYPTRPTKTY